LWKGFISAGYHAALKRQPQSNSSAAGTPDPSARPKPPWTFRDQELIVRATVESHLPAGLIASLEERIGIPRGAGLCARHFSEYREQHSAADRRID
jgi:hypothetical protein